MHVRDGRYAYTSVRQGGRVRSVYLGTIDSVAVAEYLTMQAEKAAALEALRDEMCTPDDVADMDIKRLAWQAMQERGYTRNKNRHWRKRRS